MGKNILKFKLFESTDEELDELLDNFANISDILGKPSVLTKPYGKFGMYMFQWKLDIDLSNDNDVDNLVNFGKIMREIIDVSATKKRMEQFDFKVSLTNWLIIKAIPKSTEQSTYQFINKEDGRAVYLNEMEIVRFFRDKGVDVLKIVVKDYYEQSETSEVEIKLSNDKASTEFMKVFDDQCSETYRQIGAYKIRSCEIAITPTEEKTYINLS